MSKVLMTFDEVLDFVAKKRQEQGLTYTQMMGLGGISPHLAREYLTGGRKNRTGGNVEIIAASLGVDAKERFVVQVDDAPDAKTFDPAELRERIKIFMEYSPFNTIPDRAVCRAVCREILRMLDIIEKEAPLA